MTFITFDEANQSLTVVDGKNQTIDLEAESVTITRAGGAYRCDIVRAGQQARASAVPAAPERAFGVIREAPPDLGKLQREIDAYLGIREPASEEGDEVLPPMDDKALAKAARDIAEAFGVPPEASPEETVPSSVAKDVAAFFGVEQEGEE
jgi:hypothetical protein